MISVAARGPILWRKRLTATDAQRQKGHATGDLRLVQAGYPDRKTRIDQTTYFRRQVFVGLAWQEEKADPHVEVASIKLDVTIQDKHFGVLDLTLSHKPTGEAGQRNYTTNIRWGSLASELQKTNVTGLTVTLYAPPAGSNSPWFIEIG